MFDMNAIAQANQNNAMDLAQRLLLLRKVRGDPFEIRRIARRVLASARNAIASLGEIPSRLIRCCAPARLGWR